MKHIALLLSLFLLSSVAAAVEIAGVDLPEQVTISGDNRVLYLNGAGIREKFFFDIYLAALYVSERSDNPSAIIGPDRPKRVQMDMLYKEVERQKFIDGWNEGFAANNPPAAMQALRERLDRFNALFQTLVAGDRVVLDYLPGSGTRVIIKGQERGVIPGFDFNQALLKVWLGDKPVTGPLKKALLGR